MEKLIFFVDDDKMILNLLEYTIKNRHDYDVRTFSSGEECLKNMDLKPDLIVMDHYFKSNGKKNMSGLEALKEIQKYDRSLPIVILTSSYDKKLAKKYLEKGAIRYIPKNDYFIDELMLTIDQNLS
jgi:two-component system, OmpR family, response regulator